LLLGCGGGNEVTGRPGGDGSVPVDVGWLIVAVE